MAEALKCRGFATVIAEFPSHARVLDLTATRRLTLAAQEGMGFGIILRHTGTIEPNAATTRWFVSTPSRAGKFGGIGPARFHLDLVKNRFVLAANGKSSGIPMSVNLPSRRYPGSLARTFADRSHRTPALAKAS
jgi:protein ImuA